MTLLSGDLLRAIGAHLNAPHARARRGQHIAVAAASSEGGVLLHNTAPARKDNVDDAVANRPAAPLAELAIAEGRYRRVRLHADKQFRCTHQEDVTT
jgi:hypothetical protein